MFISSEQRHDKKFMAENKRWITCVMADIKAGKAPAFSLEGPCELTCRMRPRADSRNMAFIGNEEFHLTGIVRESDPRMDGEHLKVTMSPKMGKAPMDIMAITMPLLEAVQTFTGLEAWMFDTQRATSRPEKPKDPVLEHAPVRPSQQWGDF